MQCLLCTANPHLLLTGNKANYIDMTFVKMSLFMYIYFKILSRTLKQFVHVVIALINFFFFERRH